VGIIENEVRGGHVAQYSQWGHDKVIIINKKTIITKKRSQAMVDD